MTPYSRSRFDTAGNPNLDGFSSRVYVDDFGGLPNGSDTTTAFNNAVAAAVATAGSLVVFGRAGQYIFNSPVYNGQPLPSGINLISEAPTYGITGLVRNYIPQSPVEPFINISNDDCGLSCLSISSVPGKVGGAMVVCGSTLEAGFCTFDRIYITYDEGTINDFQYGVLIDGSGNVKAGGQGWRDQIIRDSFIFGGEIAGLYILNSVNGKFSNTWINQSIYLGGKGPGTSASNRNAFNGVSCLGPMTIDYAEITAIAGSDFNGLILTPNSSYTDISGSVNQGPLSIAGSRNRVNVASAPSSWPITSPPCWRDNGDATFETWCTAVIGTSYVGVPLPVWFPNGILDVQIQVQNGPARVFWNRGASNPGTLDVASDTPNTAVNFLVKGW